MADTAADEGADPKTSESKPRFDLGLERLVGPSQVYIVEHFVALIMLVLVVISGIGLFNALIDYLFEDGQAQAGSLYTAIISVEQLALYMAIALVAVPGFLFTYTRTRKSERKFPELRKSRARRRLEYVFLAIGALFKVGYIIGFVYTSVLVLVNAGAGVSGESWYQSSLKQWFAIILIGLVLLLVSRMVPRLDGGS